MFPNTYLNRFRELSVDELKEVCGELTSDVRKIIEFYILTGELTSDYPLDRIRTTVIEDGVCVKVLSMIKNPLTKTDVAESIRRMFWAKYQTKLFYIE